MSHNVREGKKQQLTHHDLIKIIVDDALSKSRVLVLWSTFRDMDREAFLETQVLALGGNPTSSVEGKGEEEEDG